MYPHVAALVGLRNDLAASFQLCTLIFPTAVCIADLPYHCVYNCVHQLCIPTVCTNFVHWLPLRLCASAATNNRNLLRVRFKRYRTGTEKYTVQYGPPRNNATNYLCFAAVRSALIFRSGSRAVLMATTKNYNYN